MDLTTLCADHKAFDLGLEVINIGLHRLPNSDALLIQRAMIYAMSGKFDLAEKDFQRVGQTEADKDAASVSLGLCAGDRSNQGAIYAQLGAALRKEGEPKRPPPCSRE